MGFRSAVLRPATLRQRLRQCAIGLWGLVGLCLGAGAAGAQTDGALYALDALRSNFVRLDPQTGAVLETFATPVLCQPEGACGLAYDGHSLFYVDSTDPARRIYELNPRDGAIWNSMPAPSDAVDGLAWDGGALYALSFSENRIYRLSLPDGTVDRVLEIDSLAIGGLAAENGRLLASSVLSGEIYDVDPQSGAITSTLLTDSAFPAGLALLDGRLYVGDYEGRSVLRVDPDSGAEEAVFDLGQRQVAALAAGPALREATYELQIEAGDQTLLDDGRVEIAVRALVVDGDGALLASNDDSRITFEITQGTAEVVGRGPKQTVRGVAEARVRLAIGARASLRAVLSDLTPPDLNLGGVAPAAALALGLERLEGLQVQVEASVLDANGLPAVDDTSRVAFVVERGEGVVVGASVVRPEDGVARTTLQVLDGRSAIEVKASLKDFSAMALLEPEVGPQTPTTGGGLTVSGSVASGGDEKSPAPPGNIRTLQRDGRVEISWDLSPEDGEVQWVVFNGRNIAIPLVEGYRVYRRTGDGLYEPIGGVGTGVSAFVDEIGTEEEIYRYKVLATDGANLSEAPIVPGSAADEARTVRLGLALPLDADGEPVLGLFSDEDLLVDFNDFFLFADNFGFRQGEAGFDPRFDLDGDGEVGFNDFFLFADNFGRQAVSRP